MTCISATRKAFWEAQLAKKYLQLDTANTTYDELLARNAQDYSLNTRMEGDQRVKIQDLDRIKRQIVILEKEIDGLEQKLAGGGIMNLNLRRIV